MQEEKTYYGDNVVYLKMLTPEDYLKLENPIPSSVHCFPVKNDEILFTINPRGLDIIGGHIEKGETAESAMIREGMEEGCIEIKSMKLIGAIQVDNRDNPKAEALGYPKVGYQLFYAVDNFTMLPFVANFECTDRKFVNKEDISKQHHKWLNVHDELLNSLNKIVSSTLVMTKPKKFKP
jgi:8-oxo-dGTP pyrophosphatase MutT (NUDIX family)